MTASNMESLLDRYCHGEWYWNGEGIPLSVLRQQFREFADEVRALGGLTIHKPRSGGMSTALPFYPAPGTYWSLREANVARQAEWDGDEKITPAYRGNEMAGEIGEALEAAIMVIAMGAAGGKASNVIKKLERGRLGIAGSRASVGDLADELADVVICADLIAIQYGIDLDAAVARKFNVTSEKVGLKTRLAPSVVRAAVQVTMAEIRARGLGDDVLAIVSEMTGEHLRAHVAKQVPMADLALFGYAPPCPCGERGMLPGDEIVGESCAECAAAEAKHAATRVLSSHVDDDGRMP